MSGIVRCQIPDSPAILDDCARFRIQDRPTGQFERSTARLVGISDKRRSESGRRGPNRPERSTVLPASAVVGLPGWHRCPICIPIREAWTPLAGPTERACRLCPPGGQPDTEKSGDVAISPLSGTSGCRTAAQVRGRPTGSFPPQGSLLSAPLAHAVRSQGHSPRLTARTALGSLLALSTVEC
jgi:hypothetical protein